MAVTFKPSLAGLVASLMPYDGLHQTYLFWMLCKGGTHPAPWTVFDNNPGTTYPGTFDDIKAAGLEVDLGVGNYVNSIYTPYTFGQGVVNFDPTAQELEIGLPSGPTWTGDPLFSLDYRYIVVGAYTDPSPPQWYNITTISVIDTGATTTLAAQPLSLTFTASTAFPGTYPLARWTV